MNKFVVHVLFIVGIIAIFVIIDRKDFYPSAPVQSSQTKRDANTWNHPVSGGASEQGSVSDSLGGPEEKKTPVSVPGVNREESEQANPDAVITLERSGEMKGNQRDLLAEGYGLICSEDFKNCKPISISKANEDRLVGKGYDVESFKKQKFPAAWSIDYSYIPSDVVFQNLEDGFGIVSNQGGLRFVYRRIDGMGCSFVFVFSVRNNGADECDISFAVHDLGSVKRGYTMLETKKIPAGETERFEVGLSAFEQMENFAPVLIVHGSAILEDFYVYQKSHEDFTIVEGEITERSALPDPKSADYPDCRFTAHFIGNAIISGLPCNKELSLSIDGFRNKRLLNTASLEVGDKVRCAIVPIEAVPDGLASIQEADDLSLFTLDSYLAATIRKIESYADSASLSALSTHFKSDGFDFKSVFDEKFNPPIADGVALSQKERIRKDLETAETMLQSYESARKTIEPKFQDAWSKEKKRFPDGYNTIENGETISLYWRNVNHSFWCLPPRYSLVPEKLPTISDEKMDAMIAFRDFLESNGIQFIVSLVPDRYEIASRVINQDFADVPVYQLASYVKQFSEAGIECPYYPESIIRHYDMFPFAYCFPNDGHCNSTVQYCIAEELAGRLSGFQFDRNLERAKFSHVQAPTFYDAVNPVYKYPENCDIENHEAGTCYTSDEIHYDGKVLAKDPDSQILVVGNSFIQTPMGASQNSLPAFLAERMLCATDDYRVDQKGPMSTIIQRFFDNPQRFLKGKKVLVMQVSSGYLGDNSFTWNNIRTMDKQRMLLNGKRLVSTLSIAGEGNYAKEIVNSDVRAAWERFAGKHEIMIASEDKREILRQSIDGIDKTKPFVCIVSSVRSSAFSFPTLSVNGVSEPIPAGYAPSVLTWQEIFFSVPAGSSEIRIELQGKKGTVVGFNQVQIYQ